LHVRVPDSVAEGNKGAKLAKNLSAVVTDKNSLDEWYREITSTNGSQAWG
jgi:hypothetical protein